jgi:hypothetical protein
MKVLLNGGTFCFIKYPAAGRGDTTSWGIIEVTTSPQGRVSTADSLSYLPSLQTLNKTIIKSPYFSSLKKRTFAPLFS